MIKKDQNYSQIIDEVDANTTYIGKSGPGASTSASAWQIKKVVINSTITTIYFADGDDNFDNIWDNRASYIYS